MKIFEVKTATGFNLVFRCYSYSTRYSWGHWCEVINADNYKTLGKFKIRYYNRTWESYTYQSVAMRAVAKLFKNKRDTATREELYQFFRDTTNKGW